MCCSNTSLFVYHGTRRKSAESIIQTGHFIPSTRDNEWAGSGIYFFINGYTRSSAKENAAKYAIKIKHLQDVVVLKADIDTNELRILDLTNQEDQEHFLMCFEFLFNEALKRFGDLGFKAIREYSPHVLECAAINSICEKMGYGAVIKSEYINFGQTPNHSHPYTSVPNCTMFCLRSDAHTHIINIHLLEVGDKYV